jgi:hypothetical protein
VQAEARTRLRTLARASSGRFHRTAIVRRVQLFDLAFIRCGCSPEHIFILLVPPSYTSRRFYQPLKYSTRVQVFTVGPRKREFFFTVCRTFQNAAYAAHWRQCRELPETQPQPIRPLHCSLLKAACPEVWRQSAQM